MGISLQEAVGILEMFWEYVGTYAKDGDIGRLEAQDIADGIEWPGDADRLALALFDAGLLDPPTPGHVVVHDWPEHCGAAVHMALARAGRFFADGTRPNYSRMEKGERERVDALFEGTQAHDVRTPCAQQEHGEPTAVRPISSLTRTHRREEEESRAPRASRSVPDGAYACAEILIKCVRQAPGGRVPPGARHRWAAELARIPGEVQELQADGADPWEHIEAAIRWALGPENLGQEYEVVIRSARSLREKWPKLVAAAQRARRRTQPLEDFERWMHSAT